jgi:LmbE family N-acetylglucosaminyl deacetylase
VRTLLAIHAHPDDETITTGGTLARYSAEGVRTVVVTCTHGNLGELNGLPADIEVGARRARELEQALRILGVSRHVQLGYADSGMAGWASNHAAGALFATPTDEVAARIAQIIDEERPQVIITYDETGGYGHPDHVKTHAVGVAACCLSGSSAKLYFVRFPRTWARAFVRKLNDSGISAPPSAATGADAGPDVTEVGTDDALVTARIDVSAYIEVKRAALACHRSQMPPEHFLMRMPPRLAAELWAFEFFSLERTESPAQALESTPKAAAEAKPIESAAQALESNAQEVESHAQAFESRGPDLESTAKAIEESEGLGQALESAAKAVESDLFAGLA